MVSCTRGRQADVTSLYTNPGPILRPPKTPVQIINLRLAADHLASALERLAQTAEPSIEMRVSALMRELDARAKAGTR